MQISSTFKVSIESESVKVGATNHIAVEARRWTLIEGEPQAQEGNATHVGIFRPVGIGNTCVFLGNTVFLDQSSISSIMLIELVVDRLQMQLRRSQSKLRRR